MKLALRAVETGDLPLLARWLRSEAVRGTWGEPEVNLRQLQAPGARGHGRAIIEAEGRPVGLVLWEHSSLEELDVVGLPAVPTSVVDLDIMIGKAEARGRGLGSEAIRLVAERALADAAVPFVMGCVARDNHASQRAFAKAGFRRDREFDDVPNGVHVLMVRHRPDRGPSPTAGGR